MARFLATVALLALASLQVLAAEETTTSTTPLLIWSYGSKEGQHESYLAVDASLSEASTASVVLDAFVTPESAKKLSPIVPSLQKQVKSALGAMEPAKSKVIVGFVFKALNWEALAQSSVVKDIMGRSSSASVVIPFTTRSAGKADLVDELYSVAENEGIQVVQLDSSKSDLMARFAEELKSKSTKSDKSAKLILITFPEKELMKTAENVIMNIHSALPKGESTQNFLGFLTASSGDEITAASAIQVDETFRRQLDEFVVYTGNQTNYKIRTRPELFVGMILTLVLGLTLLVYLCCMHEIQAGSSFATRYPAKGKEFN